MGKTYSTERVWAISRGVRSRDMVWLDFYGLHNKDSTGGCRGAHSAAKRSYPTSEVRGRSREDPMPEGLWPREVTPRQRSGAATESARVRQCRNSREELPNLRGQGRWTGGATPRPRRGGCVGAGGPRGAIPCSRLGGVVVRRYHSSKVRSRGCALLEQP